MSMMMYKVIKCNYCGSVKPQHNVASFPKNSVIKKKKVFSNKMHNAYHCRCDAVCKGSQFYCKEKKKQMEWYKKEHNGQEPWDVNSDISEEETNATICDLCSTKINDRNLDGKLWNICLCCLEYRHIQLFY